jgi:hypothetical protein
MTGVRAFGSGAVHGRPQPKRYQLGPTSISECLSSLILERLGRVPSCQAKTLCKGQKSIQ